MRACVRRRGKPISLGVVSGRGFGRGLGLSSGQWGWCLGKELRNTVSLNTQKKERRERPTVNPDSSLEVIGGWAGADGLKGSSIHSTQDIQDLDLLAEVGFGEYGRHHVWALFWPCFVLFGRFYYVVRPPTGDHPQEPGMACSTQ